MEKYYIWNLPLKAMIPVIMAKLAVIIMCMRKLMKVIILIFCILTVCSCKKDYRKLATEFERRLPDTAVVVNEQINDIDHFVYYKNKGNNYLVRHNLDDNTEESIKPKLEDGEYIQGIYLGKENIAFLVTDGNDGYSFWYYNLKTLKFSNIDGGFYGAYANEADKTFVGFMDFAMGRLTTKYVYDFDGKKVSEEETEVEEESPQEKVKNWQCVYCGTVVASPTKPPTANCPARPFDGGFFLSHYWQYLGDAQ